MSLLTTVPLPFDEIRIGKSQGFLAVEFVLNDEVLLFYETPESYDPKQDSIRVSKLKGVLYFDVEE